MLTIRVRACVKCQEYIIIYPNNPINQVHIRKFEKNHTGHTLVTLDITEVKNQYKSRSLHYKNLNEELSNIS